MRRCGHDSPVGAAIRPGQVQEFVSNMHIGERRGEDVHGGTCCQCMQRSSQHATREPSRRPVAVAPSLTWLMLLGCVTIRCLWARDGGQPEPAIRRVRDAPHTQALALPGRQKSPQALFFGLAGFLGPTEPAGSPSLRGRPTGRLTLSSPPFSSCFLPLPLGRPSFLLTGTSLLLLLLHELGGLRMLRGSEVGHGHGQRRERAR